MELRRQLVEAKATPSHVRMVTPCTQQCLTARGSVITCPYYLWNSCEVKCLIGIVMKYCSGACNLLRNLDILCIVSLIVDAILAFSEVA